MVAPGVAVADTVAVGREESVSSLSTCYMAALVFGTLGAWAFDSFGGGMLCALGAAVLVALRENLR